ncbi:sensor histidine kinase [Paracraurococcus lichenis]|uniref:histidine kinase n=1 Tax=Paracraurococcus lichenis TaxID=3064888 RepID=A0ABT9ECF8_9PROT|nr:DUF4118 domain-containing protein [Paracraurococcus sp. LOR1-02]MDO9713789.1 DUF4118 domain-containing protein [Paracraurococcus sp. LOR1-02]
MPYRTVFNPKLLHRLPTPARWAGAALLVLIAFAVRFWLLPVTTLPFLLFFPPIILAAVLFGRGSGFVALALSTIVAWHFFLPPFGSFAIPDKATTLNLVLFATVGAFVAGTIETLHAAYVELDRALDRAEAGEQERELLLAEFSHRVKNDMQRIIGTMLLQASGSDAVIGAALRTAAERVRVIARVHDRLAQRKGHALVHIDEYLHDLILDLRSTIGGLRPIGLFIEAERHLLSVSRAGLMGLVVNELVTNVLKYAFPDEGREGIVRVSFRRDGEDYVLMVVDNGVGMHATQAAVKQEAQTADGMGRRLVRALAAQLGGHFDINEPPGNRGTACTLRFPVWPPGDQIEER